jgi:NADH-quinone oxidoreductase subunit D
VSRRIVAGVGAVADVDLVVPIAPQHPSAHGALQLALTVEGERVRTAEPVIGYMHRGAEKLFEVRDYRQILMLANRHDWLSGFGSELGVVLAVERLLGITVPERGRWLRTLLAELTRAAHHLAFLAATLPAAAAGGASGPLTHPGAAAAREALQRAVESVTGGRVHPMYNRVGGLLDDVPDDFPAGLAAATAAARAPLAELADLLDSAGVRAATVGVGRLGRAAAEAYGVSGPAGRASGLDLDLRRDDPYLGYPELGVPVAGRTAGDCAARLAVLLEETATALDLTDAAAARLFELPPGPVAVRTPRTVRAPESEICVWTENPAGINGYWLVSRGGPTPWRLKLRTASFNNVQALRTILPGATVAQLPTILGSLFFVAGDLDK